MAVKNTSIKRKIALSFMSVAALLTALTFAVLAMVLLPNTWHLEEQLIEKALLRTTKALDQEIVNLGYYTDDWAYWDDTYRYMVGELPGYEQSNLTIETLHDAKLGFMSLTTTDGKIVWGRYFRPGNEGNAYAGAPTVDSAWPEPFLAKLEQNPEGVSGFYSSHFGKFFFTARPVLNNYRKGPSHGWIITGRWLDKAFATRFENQMQQPVSFQHTQFENIKFYNQKLNENVSFYIKRPSFTTIRTKAIINDYKNDAAFTVTIDEERNSFIELCKAMLIAMLGLTFVGLFCTWFAYRLVQKVVLDPLSSLTSTIEHFGLQKKPLPLPKFNNSDEISMLYDKFHEVTGALFKAQRALEERSTWLEVEALTDPLTKLHNRRYLDRLMAKVSNNVLNDPGQQKLLLLIDIDHFKLLNDSYGHTTGDKILIQLASVLKSTVREQDHVVRMGGEEFLIIATCQGKHESQELAERIRLCVKEFKFTSDLNEPLAVSVSIGYAWFPLCLSPLSGENWQTALKLADYALYQVKEFGRDSWCGYYAEPSNINIQSSMIPSEVDKLVKSKILQQLTPDTLSDLSS